MSTQFCIIFANFCWCSEYERSFRLRIGFENRLCVYMDVSLVEKGLAEKKNSVLPQRHVDACDSETLRPILKKSYEFNN